MTTRQELYAVGNEMQPLKRLLRLPFPVTPLLEDAVLMRADSIAATQESLAREAQIMARQSTSPLIVTVVPERVEGSILALHT